MTLTSDQPSKSILQLAQALFNATPGKIYLEALTSKLTAGLSLADLINELVWTDIFFGKKYSDEFIFLEPAKFAEVFINDLIGDISSISSTNRTALITHIVSQSRILSQPELVNEHLSALSSIPYSDRDWGKAALHYSRQSITKIMDNLVGNTISDQEKATLTDHMFNQVIAGQSLGSMVEWVMTALDQMDHSNPVWGKAAALFDNRIEVSQYYSIDKQGNSTYLPILQQVLIGVTPEADSIVTSKSAIDSLLVSIINLSNLNGSNGFQLLGKEAYDRFGKSVSSAGDFNGDGFDDLIIGAHFADPNGSRSGASYIIFGKDSGFSPTLDLLDLDGTHGFLVKGVSEYNYAGISVSNAGDVNGDGLHDVIIGANYAYPNGVNTGASYIVFGQPLGFNSTLDLASLDGHNGFRLEGVAEKDDLGFAVNSAGDINGDGFSDLIVGAPGANLNGKKDAGASYVVFGKSSGFDAELALSNLDGTNGFRIEGIAQYDHLGFSVSNAGDINGDGFDELIIGAQFNFYLNPGYQGLNGLVPKSDRFGESYVIYGKATGFDSSLNLSNLNGENGFRIEGSTVFEELGASVSGGGDLNGDGFDDFIISSGDTNFSYVIFGQSSSFGMSFKLSDLDGENGFRFVLRDTEVGYFNHSVTYAGDINGDGFGDLIMGVPHASPNETLYAGSSHVIFGRTHFPTEVNLLDIEGENGFRIDGVKETDYAGIAVNSAGDLNGDGFDDLIIGTPYSNQNNFTKATGSSYVLFGGSSAGELIHRGSTGVDFLIGTPSDDRFAAGIGDDSMDGKGGKDVFHGGAGNDTMMISDLNFQRVDGGSGQDTLSLEGHQLNFNLANFRNRINSIETINLTGSGDNTLTLSALDLLNLSDTSNTLTVDGNTGDHVVVRHSNWVNSGIKEGYQIYTYNAAVLKVGINVATEFL